MKVKIGKLEINDTTMGIIISIYATLGYVMGSDMIVSALADNLKVKKSKVIGVLNLMENVAIDTFTFAMFEVLAGNMTMEEYKEMVDVAIKYIEKEWKSIKPRKFGMQLTLATLMAQIDTLRRVAEIGNRLQIRVLSGKYDKVKNDWIRDLAKLVVYGKVIVKKRLAKEPLEILDLVGIIKSFLSESVEKEMGV